MLMGEMMITNCLRKIILSFLLIYSFDFFVSSLNIFIPINFLTLAFVTFFDVPAMLCLIVFFITF